ncbi:hypothetical protein PHYPO_G00231990 [Pangasianodon hypophthalmus]|uniref:Secreted protein n=1 Tax=Pangasianodon hypophthalmus TaxID=310915 RepID=A0A5N5NIR4_PANHP|nr:hypothetical protein PHYPO_G00231990 [Pangasianodon hypophthalmus]
MSSLQVGCLCLMLEWSLLIDRSSCWPPVNLSALLRQATISPDLSCGPLDKLTGWQCSVALNPSLCEIIWTWMF